jgi:uncharacterized protein DUF5996
VSWPSLPYEEWAPTLDTLHAHTQVLGKVATKLAPPQPQLQHSALRLSARGFETDLLPAPDGSGSFDIALDLHRHEALVEHVDGRERRVPLIPNRTVAEVYGEVLAAVAGIAGPVDIDPRPQETAWETPLDEDSGHATYDVDQVADYLVAASRAAAVLAELRAPFRGRSTRVNAWWGGFDLAVSLFSGRPADPPSSDFIFRNSMDAEELAVGWWPGDFRYPHAAFYAYAHPAPAGLPEAKLAPAAARWEPTLGEFILDWADVCTAADPHETAAAFTGSFVRHACLVCGWDPKLAASLDADPPPVS